MILYFLNINRYIIEIAKRNVKTWSIGRFELRTSAIGRTTLLLAQGNILYSIYCSLANQSRLSTLLANGVCNFKTYTSAFSQFFLISVVNVNKPF